MASNDPYVGMEQPFKGVTWADGNDVRRLDNARARAAMTAEYSFSDLSLTFAALRRANELRCPLFKNAKGEAQHSGRDWYRTDWYVAVLGELGELANLLKKSRRGDFTLEEGRDSIAGEFADVMIYLDMFAHCCGHPLPESVPYTSFDGLRKATNFTAGVILMKSPNESIVQVNRFFGGMASALIESQTNARDLLVLPSHLDSLVMWLDVTARFCGIDLGASVVATFNQKSTELGLPIFLIAPDKVVDTRPEVTSGQAGA